MGASPPSLLPRDLAGPGVGQALALTGEGQHVLMVQGPSGHRGANVDHLPAATETLHFAPTEALPRSQKGQDPALMAAPHPVGEPARSVQTPASHHCALTAANPAGLDVAVEGGRAEA